MLNKSTMLSGISVFFGTLTAIAQETEQLPAYFSSTQIYLVLGVTLLLLFILVGFRRYKSFHNREAPILTKEEICQGSVKWFNPRKGFGFIQQDNGEDLFVHQSEIKKNGFRALNKNDRVAFRIGRGKKGPVAKEVEKVS